MARRRNNVVDLREALWQQIKATPIKSSHPYYDAAFLRQEFVKLAIIAEIPPTNVDAFLQEVADHVFGFESASGIDRLRQQRRTAINELMTAARRMMAAIERVQKYIKRESDDPGELLFDRIFRDWPTKPPGQPSMADLKRELTELQDSAKVFSNSELPKRGKNRTKTLLKNIWLSAQKFGGGLTYDKKTGRGTLIEVIAFFDMPEIWTNLSPSTLDRLRPR